MWGVPGLKSPKDCSNLGSLVVLGLVMSMTNMLGTVLYHTQRSLSLKEGRREGRKAKMYLAYT